MTCHSLKEWARGRQQRIKEEAQEEKNPQAPPALTAKGKSPLQPQVPGTSLASLMGVDWGVQTQTPHSLGTHP